MQIIIDASVRDYIAAKIKEKSIIINVTSVLHLEETFNAP